MSRLVTIQKTCEFPGCAEEFICDITRGRKYCYKHRGKMLTAEYDRYLILKKWYESTDFQHIASKGQIDVYRSLKRMFRYFNLEEKYGGNTKCTKQSNGLLFF